MIEICPDFDVGKLYHGNHSLAIEDYFNTTFSADTFGKIGGEVFCPWLGTMRDSSIIQKVLEKR